MSWLPIDCHAHTRLSDGELEPEELIEVVRSRGVRPSIADHLSADVRYSIKSVDEVRAYLDRIDGLDVARAGEFCWHDTLWRELPEDVAGRFTHRVGSVHSVALPEGSRVWMFGAPPEGMTPARFMDLLVDDIEQLSREMPVDILAHPTLAPPPYRKMPAEELWTEEHEERVARALSAAGIAFEISARYRPHERLVRRIAEEGGRVSLGSDGHSREQVGDLRFPLELARRCGIVETEIYDPFVHGSRGPAGMRHAVHA